MAVVTVPALVALGGTLVEGPHCAPIFPSALGQPFPGLRLTMGDWGASAPSPTLCALSEPHSRDQIASCLGLSVSTGRRVPAPSQGARRGGGALRSAVISVLVT